MLQLGDVLGRVRGIQVEIREDRARDDHHEGFLAWSHGPSGRWVLS